MEPDIVPPTVDAIRRWSGVEPPNAAALHGLADMAHLIADIERARAGLAFEDEPSGFEAALLDLKEPG
ncbi:MAG: hypothetical protein AVDCRST_MAG04-2977 [uncultured Acetobacteraceae bacterium]|jgi:hypothetical protein|uniref:Uncharacterized protein n=1 Tax=uncultured Acetobacteraceae bacterium TaxID=169975 RepID=A0A6J4J229_9PROT|nr:MAG: hypothetical protein AVDCRST_MAG04-2977 [uncultured Acetobacteraceae bacterium]